METIETTAMISMTQEVAEIQARILNLDSLFESSLQMEMDALKETLLKNPNAAGLLKDEDIGLLVKNLNRLVATDIQEANDSKRKPKEKKATTRLTKEEIDAALAEEGL